MPVSRQPQTPTSCSSLAANIAEQRLGPKMHDNNNPLWQGPCGEGPLGGITQSMLVRFLSCRERFRLKYVLGLEPHDKWNHRLGYGNMWHVCEEAHAKYQEPGNGNAQLWCDRLLRHTQDQMNQYPFQRDDINKWHNACKTQFPEYVKYWSSHPDVKNRTPLMQEQVFDVPYTLPSGRIVRLRGKFDSVDLIDGGVYLQENKTKGDVDRQQIERQLKFDLQTMMYLVALIKERTNPETKWGAGVPVLGVRYNVVRRPFSGGKGSIKQREATQGSKCPKCKGAGDHLNKTGVDAIPYPRCPKCNGNGRIGGKPGESDEHYYGRLRDDYIAKEPDYWFFRVRSEVSQRDMEVFRQTCLDPLLETVCIWYDWITKKAVSTWNGWNCFNYRTPFGVYSALEDGGSTEYDAFLETGSEAGLRRVETLFPELQDAVA